MKLEKVVPNLMKVAIGDTKIIYFSYGIACAFYDGITHSLHTNGLYDRRYEHPIATKKHIQKIRDLHGIMQGVTRIPAIREDLDKAIIQNF